MAGAMKMRKSSRQSSPKQQGQKAQQGQQNQGSQPTQKANPAQMNDRDRLFDILTTEKHITSLCNQIALEGSHESLHRDLMACLNETQACHRELFHLMFQRGWYNLRMADGPQVQQVFQQFQSLSQQFPYGQNASSNNQSNFTRMGMPTGPTQQQQQQGGKMGANQQPPASTSGGK